MTVETTTNVAVFLGNDVADTFDYTFKVFEVDHLVVSRRRVADGITDKTYTNDEIEVSGLGEDAGSVRLLAGPLASTFQLIVQRVVPILQSLDIVNQGGFYPDTLEQELDEIVMSMQELYEQGTRSLHVQPGEGIGLLPPASQRANQFFAFDSLGNPTTASGTGADGALRADLGTVAVGKGAALIKVSPFETLDVVLEQEVRLTTYGGVFDLDPLNPGAATDNAGPLVLALADLRAMGGGTLLLPPGLGVTRSMVDIPVDVPICIRGTGQRKNYPSDLVSGRRQPSTIVPLHNGRCAFRFVATTDGNGGFIGEYWNLSTLLTSLNQDESADTPDCGFGWDCANAFYYGATFEKMGIHNFRKSGAGSAFDVYRTGVGSIAVGAILIKDCHINFNNWAWRNLDSTYTNGFRFVFNKAGKNGRVAGRGCILVYGPNIAINNNVLESNYETVQIRGSSYQGAEVRDNYFEANTGQYCIYCRERNGLLIGPNNFSNHAATNEVLSVANRNGHIFDPHWSQGDVKIDSLRRPLNNAQSLTFFRADDFRGRSWGEAPLVISKRDVANSTALVREVHPGNGLVMPATAHDTTAAIFADYAVGATITGAAGDWVCASMLLRRLSVSNTDPVMRLTTTSAAQTQDFTFSYVQSAFLNDEWMILTCGMKLAAALSGNTTVRIYPYGTGAGAGLLSNMCHPYVYSVNDVNKIRPYASPMLNRVESAAPTTGTWEVGDFLYKRSIAAAGVPGFVCTTAGTPGTWKALAAVAA
jgi:hypothetical protein